MSAGSRFKTNANWLEDGGFKPVQGGKTGGEKRFHKYSGRDGYGGSTCLGRLIRHNIVTRSINAKGNAPLLTPTSWMILAGIFALVFVYLAITKVSEGDYFAAVGSWFGAIAVIITAWVAFTQLSDLRRAAQFDSLTRVLAPFYETPFLSASNLLARTFPFPNNPADLEFSKTLDKRQKTDLSDAINLVLNYYERLGLFLEGDLVDSGLLLEAVCLQVVDHCKQLRRYIDHSTSINEAYLNHVRYLRDESERHIRERGYGGPTNLTEALVARLDAFGESLDAKELDDLESSSSRESPDSDD